MTKNKPGMIVIEVSRETEFTEDQRTALIAALEFLFGAGSAPDGRSIDEIVGGSPFGFQMWGLFLNIWEPGSAAEAAGQEQLIKARLEYPLVKSPVSDEQEWRRVALEKWRHYKRIYEAYERGEGYGNSHVALDVHEAALVHLIPFLLGVPDEAIDRTGSGLKQETPKELGERAFREAEERGPRSTLPICGAVYTDGDFRAECTVDRSWPHKEHSSGDWHWRTTGPGDPHANEDVVKPYPGNHLDWTQYEDIRKMRQTEDD